MTDDYLEQVVRTMEKSSANLLHQMHENVVQVVKAAALREERYKQSFFVFVQGDAPYPPPSGALAQSFARFASLLPGDMTTLRAAVADMRAISSRSAADADVVEWADAVARIVHRVDLAGAEASLRGLKSISKSITRFWAAQASVARINSELDGNMDKLKATAAALECVAQDTSLPYAARHWAAFEAAQLFTRLDKAHNARRLFRTCVDMERHLPNLPVSIRAICRQPDVQLVQTWLATCAVVADNPPPLDGSLPRSMADKPLPFTPRDVEPFPSDIRVLGQCVLALSLGVHQYTDDEAQKALQSITPNGASANDSSACAAICLALYYRTCRKVEAAAPDVLPALLQFRAAVHKYYPEGSGERDGAMRFHAWACYRLEFWEEARQMFDLVAKSSPVFAQACAALSCLHAGDAVSAAHRCEQLLAVAPRAAVGAAGDGAVPAPNYICIWAHVVQGIASMQLGDPVSAASSFRYAAECKANATPPPAWLATLRQLAVRRLFVALCQARQWQDIVKLLDHRDVFEVPAVTDLACAVIAHVNLRQLDKAQNLLQTMCSSTVKATPEHVECYCSIAGAAFARGYCPLAVDALRFAGASAHDIQAVELHRSGQYEEVALLSSKVSTSLPGRMIAAIYKLAQVLPELWTVEMFEDAATTVGSISLLYPLFPFDIHYIRGRYLSRSSSEITRASAPTVMRAALQYSKLSQSIFCQGQRHAVFRDLFNAFSKFDDVRGIKLLFQQQPPLDMLLEWKGVTFLQFVCRCSTTVKLALLQQQWARDWWALSCDSPRQLMLLAVSSAADAPCFAVELLQLAEDVNVLAEAIIAFCSPTSHPAACGRGDAACSEEGRPGLNITAKGLRSATRARLHKCLQ